LINYFKSYSSLSDDLFLCHPVCIELLHRMSYKLETTDLSCALNQWFPIGSRSTGPRENTFFQHTIKILPQNIIKS